jgi:hypothetical protein
LGGENATNNLNFIRPHLPHSQTHIPQLARPPVGSYECVAAAFDGGPLGSELLAGRLDQFLVLLMEHVAVIADQGFGGGVFDSQGPGSLDMRMVTSLVLAFSSRTRWKSTSLAFSEILA